MALEPAATKHHRTLPPAHYLVKIESFDVLSGLQKYECGVFEAGGYSWRLSIYPKGNKDDGGSGHISLYLSIVDPPHGQTVRANCRFFVRVAQEKRRPAIRYLTIPGADGALTSFGHSDRHPDCPNFRFGFPRFLSLIEFEDRSNGYLDAQGSCTFGAEVFVLPAEPKVEPFALTRCEGHSTYTCRFEGWSTVSTDCRWEEFSLGGRKWKLLVYPKGDAAMRVKSLSVYLEAQGLTGRTKVYAQFNLRVLDQREDVHRKKNEEKSFKRWLSASRPQEGDGRFMPLKYLDSRFGKEFVKGNTLVVEVQIIALSRPLRD